MNEHIDISNIPYPNLPIITSESSSTINRRIIGFKKVQVKKNIFCKPQPRYLSTCGFITIGILAIICWPLSCVPCCLSTFYTDYQIPIYEDEINN